MLAIIGERLGNSLGLLLFAWALSGVLGLALGVTAGALRGRWPDRIIRVPNPPRKGKKNLPE